MKILIVDDSGTMRHIQRRTLLELGYADVKEAADGEQALRECEKERFDLILMDWNMPNLSGIDALRRLKANAATKAIPVMMVTSESEKGHILEAVQAGAANYILKPFSADKLKEKIVQLMKK